MPALTTMRESLGLVAVSDNVRVWGASGRAARPADRIAVRMRNGVSLLAMAAGVSSNGASSIGFGVVGVAIRGDSERRRVWQLRVRLAGRWCGCTDPLL